MGKNKLISERIDKITNSIENVVTGEVLQTEFHRIRKPDLKQIKTKDWVFDWHKEIESNLYEVYKLTIKGDKEIQGILSLRIGEKFVFLNLIESAKFNRGKNKLYFGVLGNMFAYACKRSMDEGFKGYVSFIAKTVLKEHYMEVLGAKPINNQRMYIDTENAKKLISKYFNS